jgi:hypothetical protein
MKKCPSFLLPFWPFCHGQNSTLRVEDGFNDGNYTDSQGRNIQPVSEGDLGFSE